MSTDRTDFDIFTGFWIDWAQGRVNGSTLTLTRQDGNLLMNFIAIFIALSGKSFWRICCFIIHRSLSTTTPQDGLHHQRQAILRNADTPENGAWRLFHMLIAWKSSSRQPIRRLLPTALLASITFVALLVGGIFSSRVATEGGSEVLLTGNKCGPLSDVNITDNDVALSWIVPQNAQRSTAYSNYATQCYTDAATSEDCHLYIKPRISTSVTRNASCPFSPAMCKTKTENIIVDSGFINSQHDLGVNGLPEHRFDMRFVYHCAPLVTEGFKKVLTQSDDPKVPDVIQYFYGNLTHGHLARSPEDYTGFTFEVLRNYTGLDLPGFTTPATLRWDYRLGIVATGQGIFDFVPITQLARGDADTDIIWLDAQGIGFQKPMDDLWFSAHEEWLTALTNKDYGQAKKHLYLVDEPASPLGCATQAQICNPTLPRDKGCGPLESIKKLSYYEENGWTRDQMNALDWMFTSSIGYVSSTNLVGAIGPSILDARYQLNNGLSGDLPSNQWQIEVEHMLGTTLASLQGMFVESASGPRQKGLDQFKALPKTDQARRMCVNQKIRSNLYSNFSVAALAVILIVGAVFIIADLTMEPLLNAYQDLRAKSLPQYSVTRSNYSRLEWRVMSILQLQRMAHEGIGSGTWLRTTSETPITRPYERLGMLDIRDTKRPLLRSRTDELVEWYFGSGESKRGAAFASDAKSLHELQPSRTMKSETTSAKCSALSSKKSMDGKEQGEPFDSRAFGTRYFGFR